MYPQKLKSSMQQILDYREDLRKDVIQYVEVLCEEAVSFERYGRHQRKPNIAHNEGQNKGQNEDSGSARRTKPGTSDDRKPPPLCLNKTCADKGLRHFM